MPFIIVGSVLVIMSILREVTSGSIETRKLLPSIFSCLSYEKGNRESYWMIADSFYYKIATKGVCYSSWAIYATFIATFFVVWCFFVNGVVINRYGIPGCSHLTEQTKAVSYCFLLNLGGYSNVYINCTSNATYKNQLFCFEFKRIGRDVSPISYAVISIVLYYILVTCISTIFKVAEKLTSFATKKCLSSLIVISGVFVFVVGVAIYGTSIFVYMNLNILTGFQIIALCIDIILVGVVILRGDPLSTIKKDMPNMRRRNSTITMVSTTPSVTNSEIPWQQNGYTNPYLLHHRGSAQMYNVGHQRSHSMGGYTQDAAARRGRNPRHHTSRPFTRPQTTLTQQAIAERHHIFENLNRPTDEPPTPPLPQTSVRDSPTSSSRSLAVPPPSLTISRASTPHSSATGASIGVQPSPMLPLQHASLRPVSEMSLDEAVQQSDQQQTSAQQRQQQPLLETQHRQEKQKVQLQLRDLHTDASEASSRPDKVSETIKGTTPGAPLTPNGTLAHNDTQDPAVHVPMPPSQQVPTRPRASSYVGSEEGRYSNLFPRSPTPSSAGSNTSTLERSYRNATDL